MKLELGKIYICQWGTDYQLIGIYTESDDFYHHFDLLIPAREGECFMVKLEDEVRQPTLEELDKISEINSCYWR